MSEAPTNELVGLHCFCLCVKVPLGRVLVEALVVVLVEGMEDFVRGVSIGVCVAW